MLEEALVHQGVHQSTCRKRAVVCILKDRHGNVLSMGANHCAPLGGRCAREGQSNGKADYPMSATCNWTHAKINAISALPVGARPIRAELWGHDFFCDPCQLALEAAGIVSTVIHPEGYGSGLRGKRAQI